MSPIYQYKCKECGETYEFMWPRCDGGPEAIDCPKCKKHTAIKIPSLTAIAHIKSGFKNAPLMMQDPDTGEEKPMDRDHTIMGIPREEESKEVQKLLDIESLRSKDHVEYEKRKETFQLGLMDSDPDGAMVDSKEFDTYHQYPGEASDKERTGVPLDYPEPAHMQGKDWIKIGEKVVKEKGKRKIKPVLIEKSMVKKKGE